jgi:hypothetical protein
MPHDLIDPPPGHIAQAAVERRAKSSCDLYAAIGRAVDGSLTDGLLLSLRLDPRLRGLIRAARRGRLRRSGAGPHLRPERRSRDRRGASRRASPRPRSPSEARRADPDAARSRRQLKASGFAGVIVRPLMVVQVAAALAGAGLQSKRPNS